MVKFIHKKHFSHTKKQTKFVIYYSFSDVVLGVLLIGLTMFFVYNYLQENLNNPGPNEVIMVPSPTLAAKIATTTPATINHIVKTTK